MLVKYRRRRINFGPAACKFPSCVGKKFQIHDVESLDHFKLLTYNRCTHRLEKDLLSRVMKVEIAAMVSRIAMQATEGLLTLTSDTRKRELLLTIGVRTLALQHLYRCAWGDPRCQIYWLPPAVGALAGSSVSTVTYLVALSVSLFDIW